MNRFVATAAILLLALLSSGCPIVLTCVDIGCPSGESCDVASGQCEKVVRDCRTRPICRSGEVCDEETGECRPERLRCTQSFTCPEGQSCNATLGFCEPAFRCESAADCGLAEVCNPATQECDPKPCAIDDDCPGAYVCSDEECTPGCRPNADGCLERQFCEVLTGDSIGTCVPDCRADEDCPFGQFCDLTASPDSLCVAEGLCAVDADCRLDEICSDGNCVQPPCTSDDDCLDSQVCQTSTRTCRPAECQEDNFGAGTVPNHSRQTAFQLEAGSYTQLTLCPGRSDWFAFDARSTDIVRVRVQQHVADPDFDVFVYDRNGTLLVSGEEVATVTQLKFAPGREQTIFIELRSTNFAGGGYDLSLSTEACPNDTFEENDTLSEATVVPSAIGAPTELALRACGFDEDWFRIRQNDARNGLKVTRVQSTADLQVEVLTPDGERFEVQSEPFHALRAGAAGSTYVRAHGARGQSGAYRLAFEILDEWECPRAGQHGSALTAPMAQQGIPLIETFCPVDSSWEVDWVELDVTAGGMIDVQVRPLGDMPPLDVVLMTGDGIDNVIVRSAVVVNGVAQVQANIMSGERWFLRVSTSVNVGRLLDEPRYEVDYLIR